jgi:ABC-2 type transport system permease protein
MRLGSIEGYLASVVLVYIAILLIIYCIVAGTSTLAGEEDNGTLEMIAAMPMSRRQILTAKAVALSIVISCIMTIAGLGNAFILAIIKIHNPMDVTPSSLFAALISSLPLAFAFLMIGFFLGAILPNRRSAATALTIFFIASFFLENISAMLQSLEPLRYVSLFNYYNTTETVFTRGIRLSDILILLAVAAAFYVLALASFTRRNLTVGAWPWQTGQTPDVE